MNPIGVKVLTYRKKNVKFGHVNTNISDGDISRWLLLLSSDMLSVVKVFLKEVLLAIRLRML
jgi:hypothetical protein